MATKQRKQVEETAPQVEAQRSVPPFVRYYQRPASKIYCGAIVRFVNADGTLSLAAFPVNTNNILFADAIPHRDDPLAKKEDRYEAGVWDYYEHDKALRDELDDLRKQVAELTEAVTK